MKPPAASTLEIPREAEVEGPFLRDRRVAAEEEEENCLLPLEELTALSDLLAPSLPLFITLLERYFQPIRGDFGAIGVLRAR